VLVPVPSPFGKGGAAMESDLMRWYAEVGSRQPDIVLLDFGGQGQSTPSQQMRRHAFPDHRTLQIAAGGNTGDDVPIFPAWDSEVLAVGALDEAGRIRESSTRSPEAGKPDIFAAEAFVPGSDSTGTSFAAAYVVVAAILVWTLLPDRTPRGLRRFLLEAATPMEPAGENFGWPRRLDLDETVAAARRERVVKTLQRGRASLQAVVAMTGLNWQWAENTLVELESRGRVAAAPVGRDVVYELLDDSRGGPSPYPSHLGG